jgi:hypothetical protein
MRRSTLSIYWAFFTVVRSFSLMRQKDAAAYYTSLGDDVIDFMNEGYVDNWLFVIQSALTSEWSAPLCRSERQR